MRDNIPFFLGLIAVIALLIAALYWFVTHRLPPADWSFSFDVDAHGSDVSAEEVIAAQQAKARRLWDAELFEKVVLVSLVTVIFSRILPNAQASVTTVAIGVVDGHRGQHRDQRTAGAQRRAVGQPRCWNLSVMAVVNAARRRRLLRGVAVHRRLDRRPGDVVRGPVADPARHPLRPLPTLLRGAPARAELREGGGNDRGNHGASVRTGPFGTIDRGRVKIP